jgi:hypothetical protein
LGAPQTWSKTGKLENPESFQRWVASHVEDCGEGVEAFDRRNFEAAARLGWTTC